MKIDVRPPKEGLWKTVLNSREKAFSAASLAMVANRTRANSRRHSRLKFGGLPTASYSTSRFFFGWHSSRNRSRQDTQIYKRLHNEYADYWGVHTRHFKCTWSVFEVHLKRTCVWTDRNGSCCTWLIVLSRHGNLKTSKSRSALSSMVSTLLESALIQWKHRKLITNLSVTWSDQFHSRAREQNFVVDYRELWRFINSHRRMISST